MAEPACVVASGEASTPEAVVAEMLSAVAAEAPSAPLLSARLQEAVDRTKQEEFYGDDYILAKFEQAKTMLRITATVIVVCAVGLPARKLREMLVQCGLSVQCTPHPNVTGELKMVVSWQPDASS